MQSLKKLAKRKAKAELAEVKERVKDLKNPFSKYIEALDKAPKIVDLMIYLGLAYQSFKTFGITEKEVTVEVKVPHSGYHTTGYSESVFEALLDEGVTVTNPKWVLGRQTEPTPYTYYTTEYQKRLVPEYNYAAALIGPISLKLAQSDNIISGAAGVTMLGVLGLASVPDVVGTVARGAALGADAVASTLEQWADALVKSLGL